VGHQSNIHNAIIAHDFDRFLRRTFWTRSRQWVVFDQISSLTHLQDVLQIDVVTVDGEKNTANACNNSDLFWALRGGGGAFAVVTRAYFKAYPAFTAVNTLFGLVTCEDKTLTQRLSRT
jgi:hypothetical protein